MPGARWRTRERASRLLAAARGEIASREGGFDPGDPLGKIRVAIGQGDEQMQRIVQQHDRLKGKGVQLTAMLDGLAQQDAGGFVCEEPCVRSRG